MKLASIIIILILVISCKEKTTPPNLISNKQGVINKTESKQINKSSFDLGDFILDIDADEEDFEITKKADTVFIQKKLYKTLEGASISAKENVKVLSFKESIIIGYKQYTIDDNPARPLDVAIEKEIQTKESFYYKLIEVKDLNKWLEDNYFDDVKSESLMFQNNFYKQLLNNKRDYTKCCPEYIKQASKFLETKKESYKNFNELNTFPFIKGRIIKINFKKNNNRNEIVVIYNGLSI